MKVAILGTGDVGQALGRAFLKLGHDVKMGSREANNEKMAKWVKDSGAKASGGTFAEAAKFGELIVLCTLGQANEAALRACGAENLRDKILIDTTNPLDSSAGMPPKLLGGVGDSGGEKVQKAASGAKVVKAFNTVGNSLMYQPKLGDIPTMFICGDDTEAKGDVARLLKDFGWETADVGGIASSHYLEAMCLVWVLFGANGGGWNHAFKLLR
jgi:predicted dinucleotide-binding enzyme